jgi:hypothetical protein
MFSLSVLHLSVRGTKILNIATIMLEKTSLISFHLSLARLYLGLNLNFLILDPFSWVFLISSTIEFAHAIAVSRKVCQLQVLRIPNLGLLGGFIP